MSIEWARSIVDQCKGASIPVFVKQLGARPIEHVANPTGIALDALDNRPYNPHGTYTTTGRPSGTYDRKGKDMNEWPEDLRVREFPGVRPCAE